jgi:hypothetical protein
MQTNSEKIEKEVKKAQNEVKEEIKAESKEIKEKAKDVAKEATKEVKEAKEEVKKVAKEGKEAVKEEIKEIKEELKEEIVDNQDTKEVTQNTSAKKDNLKAKVDEIKQSAQSIYNEYTEYTDKFEQSSAELAEQENSIINNTIKKTMEHLKKLGVKDLASIDNLLNEVTLDNKEELLNIKYPSQGKAKGFILGLITSAATAVGLGAYGAKLSNLPLALPTFMSKANLDAIASKYLGLVGMAGKPALYGYIGAGAVSLLVGYIVYKIVTVMQKIKNVRYVKSLEENTVEYKQRLKDKIEDLKELLAHLDKIKLVNQKYDVILQEQNAKINRMLFIEKPKKLDDLHKTSKLEVEKTLLILDELVKLMNTKVSKDNKVSEDSIKNLASANSVINEVIKKLY